MNITHYGTRHFFMLTDCGSSHFSIWNQLARQDSATVIRQLEAMFFERGPPHEPLTDNDPAFCSSEFRAFAREWKINLRFRCAYAPARNRIAERCHHTVKRTTAKMRCSIHEAVYRHNVTPKDGESPQTASANRIHWYKVRVKGFDTPITSSDPKHSFYQIGDHVWVKVPHSWCTTKFNRGRVTGMISPQSLLVDGIPRHMKDLRPHFSFTVPEKTPIVHLKVIMRLRVEQKVRNLTEKMQNLTVHPKRKLKQSPPPRPCEEVPIKNDHYQVATFEIRRECNENNDLPRNPKRAKTCFACEVRKYSWGWGCNLYNVEMLSCKF